jgi:predicted aldo/keto reductase-like oxidoreductase
MTMEYRRLGQTGLEVSAIGLGTEYLNGQPREVVISVVREAIERGVNYIDLVFAFPEYRDNLGAALQGYRERVILAGHLGSAEKDGQYLKTRSVKKSEAFFLDLLSRLGTETVDVLLLHNFHTVNDYDRVIKPRGLMDLACRLQQEGKARFVGISAHNIEVASKAIESGQIDVLMFPINLAGNAMPGRRELLHLCAERGVGVVAMKPFAGGKLLQRKGTVRVAKYQTGGESFKARITPDITPVRCLNYVLAQVGVSTAIPGVKSDAELTEALHMLEATDAERDFSAIIADFGKYVEGECVYCNHCLPCPVAIDVGFMNRMVDTAQEGVSKALRMAYDALAAKASDCTECGACTARCPFGVDVIARMKQAMRLFERNP